MLRDPRKIQFQQDIEQIIALLGAKEELIFGVDNYDLLNELQELAQQLILINQTLDVPNEDAEEEERSIWRKQDRSLHSIKDRLRLVAEEKKISEDSISKLDDSIDEYNAVERIKQKISNVKWLRGLYEYGSYAGIGIKFVVLAWLGIKISFAHAAFTVGIVFPPLIYGFIALRALFDTGAKAYLFKANRRALEGALKRDERTYNRIASKSSQFLRTAAAATAFVFNTLAMLSFAAVLVGSAFPILPAWFATAAAGWLFVAVASGAGWISDSYIPTQRAEKHYHDLQKQQEQKPSPGLASELHKAKKEFHNKDTENTWGRRGIFATFLTASAPIPVIGPIVALVGYAIMAVVGIRGAIVSVEGLLTKKSSTEKPTMTAADDPEILSSQKYNKEPGMMLTTGAVRRRLDAEIEMTPLLSQDKLTIQEPKQAVKKAKLDSKQTSFHLPKIHQLAKQKKTGIEPGKKPSSSRSKGG